MLYLNMLISLVDLDEKAVRPYLELVLRPATNVQATNSMINKILLFKGPLSNAINELYLE